MNEQPQEEQMAAPQQEEPKAQSSQGGSGGALIALAVIVIIIIAGAFFIFGDRYAEGPKTEADLQQEFEASEDAAQAEINAINTVGESTSLSDIEADLNASDLSDLDAELDAIDQELGL